MKITDNRTITVEIDGKKHALSLSDLQRLYDMIGGVVGVNRHGPAFHPYYRRSYPAIYGQGVMASSTSYASLPKATPDVLVLNTEMTA